jgi:hypothetical protein
MFAGGKRAVAERPVASAGKKEAIGWGSDRARSGCEPLASQPSNGYVVSYEND